MTEIGSVTGLVARRGHNVLRLVASLLAVLVVVSGCATIPTEGEVVAGRQLGGAFGSDVRELISGPTSGQTPAGIVAGFLVAAQGAPDDYEVARTFLTPGAASTWRPADETVVYRGGTPSVTVLEGGVELPDGGDEVSGEVVAARLSVEVLAVVDERGRYRQQPPGTTRELEIVVQRDAGEWRISALDDVALLSESDFAAGFRNFPVFFLDPTRTFLVPEVRWFPNGRSTATRLVGELLAGPSEWLAPAVLTAFPPGTALAPPAAVVVQERAGVVDLTADALQAEDADRTLMRAQLVATLQPVLGVNRVQIRVDGGDLDDPQSVALPTQDPEVAGPAVLVAGDALVHLENNRTLAPVADLPDLSGLDVSHPGVGTVGGPYAVLTSERSELRLLEVGATEVPAPVLVGPDLTAPSVDWRGWAWATARLSTGTVTAATVDGSVREVEAAWLAGRQVTSLRLARDGARVVVASTDDSGAGHLDLAAVVRDGNGAPERLVRQEPQAQAVDLTGVSEVAWVDHVQVVVLGRTADQPDPRIRVLTLSGPASPPFSPLPQVTSVAAAKGERSVLAGTRDGGLYALAGAAWVQIPDAQGAHDPAFPG